MDNTLRMLARIPGITLSDIKRFMWGVGLFLLLTFSYFGTLVYAYLNDLPAWTGYVVGIEAALIAVIAMLGAVDLDHVLEPMHDSVFADALNSKSLGWAARPWVRLLRAASHRFKKWNEESEKALLFVVTIYGLPALIVYGQLFHLERKDWYHMFAMACTLLGIMSTARYLVNYLTPFLGAFEKRLAVLVGRKRATQATIVFGAMMASAMGEPADAVLQMDYFRDRIKEGHNVMAAIGFASVIGNGGGASFFAAPPVIIVFGTMLAGVLKWTAVTLLINVGIPSFLTVVAASFPLSNCIEDLDEDYEVTLTWKNWAALIPMGAIVWAHMHYFEHMPWWLLLIDFAIGVFVARSFNRKLKPSEPEDKESEAYHDWHHNYTGAVSQAWMLFGALIAFELLGLLVDVPMKALSQLIPMDMNSLALGMLLFWMAAPKSGAADNALISRVYVALPIAMYQAGLIDLETANFLATAVLLGALNGSPLSPVANLPNFLLRRECHVEPIDWIKNGWKYIPTWFVPTAWLIGMHGLYVENWMYDGMPIILTFAASAVFGGVVAFLIIPRADAGRASA